VKSKQIFEKLKNECGNKTNFGNKIALYQKEFKSIVYSNNQLKSCRECKIEL